MVVIIIIVVSLYYLFVLILELIETKLLHWSVHSHWLLHMLHTNWLLHSHRLLHAHIHRRLHSHRCLHSNWLLRKVLELFHHIYLLKVNILDITRGTRLICLSNVHFNTSRPTSRLSSWIDLFLLVLILILHLGLHLSLQSHIEVHIHTHSCHRIWLNHWHLSEDLTSLYRLLLLRKKLVRIYLIFKRRSVLLCLERCKFVFWVYSFYFGGKDLLSIVVITIFDSFHSLRICASEWLAIATIVMPSQHLVHTTQTVVGVVTSTSIFAASIQRFSEWASILTIFLPLIKGFLFSNIATWLYINLCLFLLHCIRIFCYLENVNSFLILILSFGIVFLFAFQALLLSTMWIHHFLL